MKPTFHSIVFPLYHSLTLSLKATSLGVDKTGSAVKEQDGRATFHPVKGFFLVTFLPDVPPEVERFMDFKWRLLDMVFYWMSWSLVYGVACTLGLYLILRLTSFGAGQLRGKPVK